MHICDSGLEIHYLPNRGRVTMAESTGLQLETAVSFCSSLKDDVWHNLAGPNAFESWHFDGVSDDGREALVVAFYDNYVLSPRFYANSSGQENVTHSGRHRFPAVSFVYSVDGKPVLNAVNEFVDGDFRSDAANSCSVIGSSFRVGSAAYGSGFMVTIDLRTVGGRRVKAELEWLLIESDLQPSLRPNADAVWNMVAPRADVSGKIMLIGRRGKTRKVVHFRGTGFHDQVTSRNVHYRDLDSRMWGRAHFTDSTIVFDRHAGARDRTAPGQFYLIRDGKIEARTASCESFEFIRDRWGLKVPRTITFLSDEDWKIVVKPKMPFRSGVAEVKMLSEISLELEDKKLRRAMGITEFVNPKRLRSPVARLISDLRIGNEDRSPYF